MMDPQDDFGSMHSNYDDNTSVGNFDVDSLGMALTFGELLSEDNINDDFLTEALTEAIEEEKPDKFIERINFKRGTQTGLAFEQYVYSRLNKR